MLVAVLPREAADPSGTWKGAFDFHGTSMPLTLNLKSGRRQRHGHGGGPSHDAGRDSRRHFGGDTVTFWVNTDYQGQTYKLVYKGKIAADQISFDFGTEDGSWSTPLTVKKSGDVAAAPAPLLRLPLPM